jgi:hypothetical protein
VERVDILFDGDDLSGSGLGEQGDAPDAFVGEEAALDGLERQQDGQQNRGGRGGGDVEASPAARPMPATAQTLAAVVSPRMAFLRRMIVPAPRKPIPLTTCAATRDGSRTIRPS